MCSCYTHSFGVHRAHEICTHVGAAIVRQAIEYVKTDGEEAGLNYAREMGEQLDTKAQDYVQKQELLEEGLDTLDIKDRFSDSWAQRAQAQAKKMTQYGSEWKCFGSECEGCEVTLTSDGFACSDSRNKGWESKFPCPGKLGAYILNETGGTTVRPNLESGHLFYVTRDHGNLPVSKGEYLVVTETDTDSEVVTCSHIGPKTEHKLSHEVVTDAIITGTLKTTTKDTINRYERNVRIVEENGIPITFAPKIESTDVFRVISGSVSQFSVGDTISVIDVDDETQTVTVEAAVPETPFGGEEKAIDYTTFQTYIDTGKIEDAYISDVFDIIVTEVVKAYGTQKIALYSPIEAKDDIKALNWDDYHPSWNDPIEGKWSVDGNQIDKVVNHLRDAGWDVWVPRDVRDDLNL